MAQPVVVVGPGYLDAFQGESVKLTRSQRSALYRGEAPRITFPGDKPCPVEPGHVCELSHKLRITVLTTKRTKRGQWLLEYRITDDRPRFVRRTPPIYADETDDRGQVPPPTAEDIAHARLHGAYTSSSHDAIDAGEAISDAEMDEMAKTAKQKDAARQLEIEAELRDLPLEDRIRFMREEADRRGIDISRQLASIEDRVKRAENKVRRLAA